MLVHGVSLSLRFWQARHPPRYAAYLIPSSPSFPHSSLKEHNHSSRFYRMLSQAMPDWKRVKSQLDNMAELYLNE
ncbi:YgjP-like metallopeptidase domain-containing protein [Bradyrhizobium liaoningense]